MAVALSAREVDEIRPLIEKVADRILGHCDTTILSAISASLRSGHDRPGLQDKLNQYLEKGDARKLSERIFDLIKDLNFNTRKRGKDDPDSTNAKKRKEDSIPEPGMPSPGQLTALQIKEMMASAQRMIEERKRALQASGINIGGSTGGAATEEKQKKLQDLQSEIQSKLALSNIKAKLEQIVQSHQAGKPTAVKIDDSGKVVDASGNEIKIPTHTPTLKANLRARRREEFKQQLQEKPVVEEVPEKFFDPRVVQKPGVRQKKGFQFHEKGKFVKEAQAIRMKAKLEKLQGEISQIARKTGISSATTLALTASKRPDRSKEPDAVPDVEWWDAVILTTDNYDGGINQEAILNLIEHPIQMNPPLSNLQPGFLPVFLTKKERKKLRRTTRREAWKEKQEKIRLGLDAPPEPKLRISNFMRALTTEATLDPTKIEAHVRAQMAKRQAQHQAANLERALTAEQKKEKKMKKYSEDTSVVVHVTVYRLKDLNNPARKYKIETNAKQLQMTGIALLFKSVNLVVVEGGPKQQKKYKRLMMDRIKWTEDTIKDRGGSNHGQNEVHLVWEGTVKERSFGPMTFKLCPSEAFAREFMRSHNVEHYWDLAYSGAMMDANQVD